MLRYQPIWKSSAIIPSQLVKLLFDPRDVTDILDRLPGKYFLDYLFFVCSTSMYKNGTTVLVLSKYLLLFYPSDSHPHGRNQGSIRNEDFIKSFSDCTRQVCSSVQYYRRIFLRYSVSVLGVKARRDSTIFSQP